MMGRKLAIACLAALTAMTMYGCKDTKTTEDAGTPDTGVDCASACKAEEYCDKNVDPPTCKNVCTKKKTGCEAPLTCDVAQEKCVTPTCNGVQCATGQGCYDPASLVTGDLVSGGDAAVCTCAPALISRATNEQVQADTCAAAGQVCDLADFNNPTATACRLPRQFEYCIKSAGCEGGATGNLECVASPFNGDAGKNRCFTKCAKTQDCPDPEMKCWPNNAQYPAALRLHCFYNYCADTQNGTDPTQYYKACPAVTNTDGQCMPYNLSDGTSMGICRQTGTVVSGKECDPNAVRPNTDKMCPAGEYCDVVQPGTATGSVRGICRTLCNAAPAGNARKPDLNCATGKVCTDETTMMPSYQQGDQLANDARVGFCRDQCDLLSDSASCVKDALGNDESCYYNYGSDTGQVGACRPTRNGASASGGDCQGLLQDDRRFDCGDRLLCAIGADDKCHKFCDISVCTDANAVCAQCDPNQKCVRDDGQDPTKNKLGICAEN